ncbi:DUF5977 domain-containing protein [Mucilaginibacter sp. X5P1]|uniref:DUF5977 domain-containing protein n=1 Tax=Mucilaginibacter sp. X5P1 TaxID=2723088 RepID=UPI001621F729|nr:DUF5977 domain-containing protein [Mucilaginibacter sp. X5P1]MBB6138215.1 hypothetical protein [Mucilaginibacter sp. X5P1]
MKKLILLGCMLICFLAGYSQSLVPVNSSIASGGTITIAGSGESNSTSGTYWNAEQQQSIVSVTPSSATSNVKLTFISATYFNKATNAATQLGFKIVNTSSVAVSVKFQVIIEGYNNSIFQETPPQTFTFTVTVQAAPQIFYNVAESGPWEKNNCSTGYSGSYVTYTVPANMYSASTQAAANQLAISAGQAHANAVGSCTVNFDVELYENALGVTTDANGNSQQKATLYVNLFSDPSGTTPYTLPASVTIILTTTTYLLDRSSGSLISTTSTNTTYTMPAGVNTYSFGDLLINSTPSTGSTKTELSYSLQPNTDGSCSYYIITPE